MTLTTEQRKILRRVADLLAPFEPGDTGYQVLTPGELFALLSLCAELGGAKDRAEWKEYHWVNKEFCLCDQQDKHDWDDARWVEEWKKREMEG